MEESLSRSTAKAAKAALVLAGIALAVFGVAFVRTFAFEYFHGDPAALQGLVRAALDAPH